MSSCLVQYADFVFNMNVGIRLALGEKIISFWFLNFFIEVQLIYNVLGFKLKHYNVLVSSMKVKVAQSCPTLGNPMICTVHGILQGRILECVAIPFSRGLNPGLPTLQVDSLLSEPPGKPYVKYSNLIQLYKYIYTHMYIYIQVFFFRLFSIIGYYKILSRVLCVTQSVLVIYLFYIQQCIPRASLVALSVKNLPAMQKTLV